MTQQVHGRVHLARGVSIAERWVVPVVAAISLVGLVIARAWPVQSVDSGDPTCALRLLTGLPCPGCGMRSTTLPRSLLMPAVQREELLGLTPT